MGRKPRSIADLAVSFCQESACGRKAPDASSADAPNVDMHGSSSMVVKPPADLPAAPHNCSRREQRSANAKGSCFLPETDSPFAYDRFWIPSKRTMEAMTHALPDPVVLGYYVSIDAGKIAQLIIPLSKSVWQK